MSSTVHRRFRVNRGPPLARIAGFYDIYRHQSSFAEHQSLLHSDEVFDRSTPCLKKYHLGMLGEWSGLEC